MIRKLLITILLLTLKNFIFSQGEISNLKIYDISEKSLAVLLNSNGEGCNFRYGKRLDGKRRRIYDFDFEYVKHSKEIKTHNPYYENNNRFVFGKLNEFFNLKSAIGLQKELFSKSDKGGVAIKYFFTGGFSLGLLKPIYYNIIDSTKVIDGQQKIYTTPRRFDRSIHQSSDIYGRAAFFKKGINNIDVIPGIYSKIGFSIEFGKNDKIINALETGLTIDAYYKEVPIMSVSKNDRIFIALFISYRYGKVFYTKNN